MTARAGTIRRREETWCRVAGVLFAVALATTLSCAPAVAVKTVKPAPAPVVESGPAPAVLALARRAVTCADRAGLVPRPDLLTLIDYSRASTEPRLWVVDTWSGRVLRRELVAHGRESGDLMATRFSNRVGSLQSSLGLFVTGETYEGRHGRSLVLHGLESGINDLAADRAIVMHGAEYVSLAFAEQNGGRIGRSHGCPALASSVAPEIIDTIRDGSPLFVYYPDVDWLTASRFLAECEAAPATAAVTPR